MKHFFAHKKKLSQKRNQLLVDFQKRLQIRFKNIDLLDTAFHHRSFSNEIANSTGNNERLEFLGDAVLGLLVANYLYEIYTEEAEGSLAKIKSVVVSEATLSMIAQKIGIDECLSLGKGEERSGGRQKKAILADAFEAVLGAFYIDSGLKEVERLVISLLKDEIENVYLNKHAKDYKSLLQEYYQKKSKSVPVYSMVKKDGPDHNQTFWVSVSLGATTYGPTHGKTKKDAEQAAAKFAWNAIENS